MPTTKKSKPSKPRVKVAPPSKRHPDKRRKAEDKWATREELMALAIIVKKHLEYHDLVKMIPKHFQGHTVTVDLGACQFCGQDHQLNRVYTQGQEEPAMLCNGCIGLMDNRGAAH